jgi:hypothetical protein
MFGLIEAGIKVFEEINSNEQRATTWQGITRMLACYEEILKEKKMSLSRQSSVLDFFRSYSGSRASPPVLLDIEYADPDDLSTLRQKVSTF